MSTAFPFYLVMTAAEFAGKEAFSQSPAWMACHFSSYGTGLSNLPVTLPQGAMVIINDRIPIHGHDPEMMTDQLLALYESLHPERFLLDLQRPGCPETAVAAKCFIDALPCPVAITDHYAEGLNCPVFLAPPPLDTALTDYLQPWSGREIWLEAALDHAIITVKDSGSRYCSASWEEEPENAFFDDSLFCHYSIRLTDSMAEFHLFRTREDLTALLQAAEALGVAAAVGLYQELGTRI